MLSTVLIIDTRTELPAKYKKCIETTDTHVVITKNLKDGICALQNLEPDMIILSDSIEESLVDFCQKIRALTYNTRPIIIALSKSADTFDRIAVLESGADDFWSEPVNIEEFKTRIKAHLRRDLESNLNNRTLLPNQKYVKKALKRVLTSKDTAVLLIELQNIRDYSAVYSELAADKVSRTLVAITKSALNEEDFLGQLDDENFIIVTNKYSAEKLATFLTFAFDTVAPKFYSNEDASRGYMLMKGENYAGMRSNFVSILIGGIVEGFEHITSVNSLLGKLKTVKNLARIPSGSNYAIDRFQIAGAHSIVEVNNNKSIYVKEDDDSLSYLIQTSLELQGYDIQTELDLNSANPPEIIILDSGKDLGELTFLKQIKSMQNFSNTKVIVTSTIHNKSEILNSGADVYLPKPYEILDLIRWIKYLQNEKKN
jgi:DNA-binding response OmpR family regulator